jgi:LDH2 family malate/lactate/ureidoglycolate dehydrogenase
VALYPGAENERRVAHDELARVVSAIYEACGMCAIDAALLASTLVASDLRGIHSHGVLRVPDYVAKLTTGGVDPRGQPRILHELGATMSIDGDNSMGQIAGTFAMERVIERAQTTGVAAAAVRGSNHCGAMDHYARMALVHDMIGIATTNALPTMAPWGGADKIVGINPIGVAIPAGAEDPIVLDIAFGATAHGKMRIYQQKGLLIPEGWAFDANGLPTTDTEAALRGLIQPIGGHKGIGLAMVTGILSSLLSGAGYGLETGNMIDGAIPGADGQFFLALHVAAFEDVATFKSRIDRIVRQIHDSRRAPGVERLYVPGEMEAEFEAQRRHNGIPLNDVTLAGIATAARRFGIRVPTDW